MWQQARQQKSSYRLRAVLEQVMHGSAWCLAAAESDSSITAGHSTYNLSAQPHPPHQSCEPEACTFGACAFGACVSEADSWCSCNLNIGAAALTALIRSSNIVDAQQPACPDSATGNFTLGQNSSSSKCQARQGLISGREMCCQPAAC